MHDEIELITVGAACKVAGGEESPISRATYYRNVKLGIFPAPVHVSPNVARINKHELVERIATAFLKAKTAKP